ncbi:MAG: tetratricopeptide repeat protein, partial [Rhabdochlamydiaceae bacterium]
FHSDSIKPSKPPNIFPSQEDKNIQAIAKRAITSEQNDMGLESAFSKKRRLETVDLLMRDKKTSEKRSNSVQLQELLTALQQQGSQNSTLYVNLGRILTIVGKKDIQLLDGTKMTQQQLYLKAIELDPRNSMAYNSLGNILRLGGSIQLLNGTEMTKQQLYLKAIELNPTNPTNAIAYTNLGTTLRPGESIQILDGKEMTKQQLYLKAIELDSTNSMASIKLRNFF